jgi:hypothetical protein
MPANISVSDSIGPALSRTGEVLFRPFRFAKWLVLALPAGLSILMEGNFGFNYNSSGTRRAGGGGALAPAAEFQNAVNWVQTNMVLVILLAVVGFAILIALWILCRWLNSRGRFMFFDNLVNNDTRIKVPWADFRQIANSLWIVRLIWDVIRWVIYAALGALVLALVWPDLRQFYQTGDYNFTSASTMALLVGIPLFFVAGVVLWILNSIFFHLAIPVMYIRRMNAVPALKIAWRELFLPHLGVSILYFLFLFLVQIVWVIWFIIALIVTCCFTVCIGYILALIPIAGSYVHGLITLPVLAFKNAYRLHFVSQFGDDYRIGWQLTPEGGFPVIFNDPATEPPGASFPLSGAA